MTVHSVADLNSQMNEAKLQTSSFIHIWVTSARQRSAKNCVTAGSTITGAEGEKHVAELNLCVLSSSSSSSALQLFVSLALLNYFFPFLPLLRRLFPIIHSHLPQVIPHVVLPSYSRPSLLSCSIRFPFVCGLGHSSIGHSFYMPQPAQSFVFYISYYIFVINCFFQFFICIESPLFVCLLCWAKYSSQYLLCVLYNNYITEPSSALSCLHLTTLFIFVTNNKAEEFVTTFYDYVHVGI